MKLTDYLRTMWRREGKPAALVVEAKSFVERHKLLMAHLARHCGVMEISTPKDAEGRIDPIAMAFDQGRRDTFLHLVALAGMSADDFEELLADIEDEIRQGDEL